MRKGITPIVSVVLLLLVTIALAGGVMVWLTGYVGGFQQDFVLKGLTCLREENDNVTLRGHIANTLDSPMSVGSITVTFLAGPTDLTLSDTSLPNSEIPAGGQAAFSIRGEHATEVLRGTYTVEFASRSIERATFNCP